MRALKRIVPIVAVLSLVVVVAAGCAESKSDQQRKQSIDLRADTFERAESVAPAPNPVNFPLRKALVEFTERQDQINHPWYIYIMGMNGNYVGYFVGTTYPQSACNFLGSTQQVDSGGDGKVVLDSPSLDGVFYGGGGASSACETMFFFDVTTNAMQTFSAPMWFASDSPLQIDVPRLNVSQ